MKNRLRKVRYVLRRYRRISQLSVLALLILSPYLRIFRFDIPTTSLYLFGMRLWIRHVFVFALLLTVVIYVIVVLSYLFGRVFCGWVCPQNLFNELVRSWEARFGRTVTLLLSALIGLFGGFVVWSYGTDGLLLLRQYAAGQVPPGPTLTILGMGAFFTAAMAWWRTGICRVACPYGHLQSVLSGPATMRLQVLNLPGNRDICATCGLCAEICHMGVDPRTPNQRDCVTCGDCLDACQLVSDARKVPRVLNFVVGEAGQAVPVGFRGQLLRNLRPVLPRTVLPGLLAVVLTSVTAYALATRPLVEVVVAKDHRTVMTSGGVVSGGSVMRVSVVNLSGVTETYRLRAEGLPPGWAVFEQEELTLQPGERADVILRVIPRSPEEGSFPFEVVVVGSVTGAEGRFRSVHVIGR
ncbi:MAG TPA: 4Fe-4S dicluster domain-containing protein [Symbiobacteriaceae bacterium]